VDTTTLSTIALIAAVATIAPLLAEATGRKVPGGARAVGRHPDRAAHGRRVVGLRSELPVLHGGLRVAPHRFGAHMLAIGGAGEFLPIVAIALFLTGDNPAESALLHSRSASPCC
jgi:hypothetical protein